MLDTLHLSHVSRLTLIRLVHIMVGICAEVALLHRSLVVVMNLRQERLATFESPKLLGSSKAHLILHLHIFRCQ